MRTDLCAPQFTATTFPILAPLPVELNASALSFFIFIRTFFQVSVHPLSVE